MNLSSLPKIVKKSLRRVGRGHGSGRVKTSGRGTKGQKARGNIGLKFAGSSLQASWLKRLPLGRGKGKNKAHREEIASVDVKFLNTLKNNSEVTIESLKTARLIKPRVRLAKIIGSSKVNVALVIKLPISEGAKKQIEKAGGSVASV
jgi:large subunit ribosomal protein L15